MQVAAPLTLLNHGAYAYLVLETNYLAKSAECRLAIAEKECLARDVKTLLEGSRKKVQELAKEKDAKDKVIEVLLRMLAQRGETSESVQTFADGEMGNASI
jgi:hypothetical protein